jgi:hypothetical protein
MKYIKIYENFKDDDYDNVLTNIIEDILKKKYPKKYKNYIIKRKANKFNL